MDQMTISAHRWDRDGHVILIVEIKKSGNSGFFLNLSQLFVLKFEKIGQKHREKSRAILTLPDFRLKNWGEWGYPESPPLELKKSIPTFPDLPQKFEKSRWPIPTHPDPIFVGILSPSRYLAHSCLALFLIFM